MPVHRGPNTHTLEAVAIGTLGDLNTELGRLALSSPGLFPSAPAGPAGPGCSGSCAAGTLCGGLCLDTTSDPMNCGGCGTTCLATEVCGDGDCRSTCPAGTTSCSQACVDTTSSSAHCGGCGRACPGGTSCVAGACAPTPLALPDLVDEVGLVLALDQTEARWARDPRASPGDSGNATLQLDIPLRVALDLSDVADALFDVDLMTTPFRVDVTAEPCGTGLDAPCADSGARTFAGYRSGIARGLGYLAGEVDVTYPAQGLNFVPNVSRHCSETSGRVRYTPLCPAVVADEATIILGALGLTDFEQSALLRLVTLARALALTPAAGVVAIILCNAIGDSIQDEVIDTVADLPPQLAALADLLINPPTAAPLLTREQLSDLGPIDATPFLRGRAMVQFEDPSGTALSNPDGSLDDAFLTTLAAGGADVTPASITLDLEPTIHWCAQRRASLAEDPARWDTGCGLCTPPDGVCTLPGAPAECACICDASAGQIAPSAQIYPAPVPGIDCAGGAADPITLPPGGAPLVASLLSGAPIFAESVRRWFANPLPAGARYVETRDPRGFLFFPVLDYRDGFFRYIVDPDDDFLSSEVDVCPDVFDPGQADDGDGDRWGAACDECPGIASSGVLANADADGDGRADGCDCDVDGDGCMNVGFEFSAGVGGPIVACSVGIGEYFDRFPYRAPVLDWDMDGVGDDCDLDRDGDGVPDVCPPGDPGCDNCPRGDGDLVFEPGIDTNPDQTDTNGDGIGDLCDRLCPPTCEPPGGGAGGAGGGGSGPGDLGLSIDLIGLDVCAGIAGGANPCSILAFLQCEGFAIDRCWNPDSYDAMVLANDLGVAVARFDPNKFGFDGGISANVSRIPDLDADGVEDLALAAPRSTKCPPPAQGPALFAAAAPPPPGDNPPPDGCDAAGAVGFVSSRTANLLGLLTGPGAGALFGAGVASQGDTLVIGAPGADGGAGAVFIYRVSASGVELRGRLHGAEPGDSFGADVAPAFGADTADPSFLAGAPGANSGDGELALLDASRGVFERFAGPVPNGRLSRGVVTTARNGQTVVVGAMPHAYSGDGALAFFTMRPGRSGLRVHRGASGSRLGASLVLWPRPSETIVVAGAPGGNGAVLAFDTRGSVLSTTRWVGSRFGVSLGAPGDIDGDGDADLLIGYALDPAGDDLQTLTVFELAP